MRLFKKNNILGYCQVCGHDFADCLETIEGNAVSLCHSCVTAIDRTAEALIRNKYAAVALKEAVELRRADIKRLREEEIQIRKEILEKRL